MGENAPQPAPSQMRMQNGQPQYQGQMQGPPQGGPQYGYQQQYAQGYQQVPPGYNQQQYAQQGYQQQYQHQQRGGRHQQQQAQYTQSQMVMRPGPMQPVMAPLAPIAGCPPGLESLFSVDALFIVQEIELIEAIFDFETNNRYSVYNPQGMRVFFAGENTECCTRCCLGARRPFLLHIYDAYGRAILDLERECTCAMCYFGPRCYGSDVTVTLRTTGEMIGVVAQDCSCISPSFSIVDRSGGEVLKITGPTCGSFCSIVMCCDARFGISESANGSPVGNIQKNFSVKELFTDANNFGFTVRPDLDVRLKALLLASVFSIDFAYFEEGGGGGGLRNINNGGGGGGGGNRNPNGFECTLMFVFTVLIIVIMVLFIPSTTTTSSSTSYNSGTSYG